MVSRTVAQVLTKKASVSSTTTLLAKLRPASITAAGLARSLATDASGAKSLDVAKQAPSPAPASWGRRDISAWDPFSPSRSLSQILNFMDQLMDVATPFAGGGRLTLSPGWEAREDDEALYLKVDMPGLGKEDVKVWVETGDTLVIRGEKDEDGDGGNAGEDQEGGGRARPNKRYFSRIELPETEKAYKLDQIKAEMKNGVLKVVVPKAAEEERDDVIRVQVE